MARKKRVAAVNGRAADGVLDDVGVDVDAAIGAEAVKAVAVFRDLGQGHAFLCNRRRSCAGEFDQLVARMRQQWAMLMP
jgi:hypothetical protein